MQSFVNITSGLPDIAADIDHSVEKYLQQPSSIYDVSSHSGVLYVLSTECTDHVPFNIGRIVVRRNGCFVSTTELLRCHAFTECLLFVIRIEGFCTPRRHFKVVLRIPICSPKDDSCPREASPLTSLGANPTQVLDHSRASSQAVSTQKSKKDQFVATPVSQEVPLGTGSHPCAAVPDGVAGDAKKPPHPVAVDGDEPFLQSPKGISQLGSFGRTPASKGQTA